jgi:hypothetical protein
VLLELPGKYQFRTMQKELKLFVPRFLGTPLDHAPCSFLLGIRLNAALPARMFVRQTARSDEIDHLFQKKIWGRGFCKEVTA